MGYISLIIGCMFSQKTTELLRRVRRYKSIGYKVLVVNYIGDNRYGKDCVSSHDKDVEKAALKKMGGSKKKNGHKPDCGCPICKNMKNSKKGKQQLHFFLKKLLRI